MAAPSYKSGFRGKALDTAYAVMMAESGGNPRAHNPDASTGDNSYGLFQINMLGNLGPDRLKRYGLKSNADLLDPAVNARVAFQMSKGGKDWSPWSAYKNGSYEKFLGKGSKGKLATEPPVRKPVSAPLQATVPGQPQIPKQALVTLNSIFQKAGLPVMEGLGDFKIGRATRQTPMPIPARVTSAQETAKVAKAIKGGPAPKLPKVQRMVSLIDYAQQLGLSVRENPYTDDVDPVHTKGSHHYQTIGKYKGKKVGRAIDVSGDAAKLRAFFAYAEKFAGKGLDDLFYDPMGYSYDRGKRWGKTIGGHGSHVHLSIR
jgi:hypothetical protein